MDNTQIPQSRAERAAFVNQMFVGMQPAENKTPNLTELLKPIRRELLAKRKAGFNCTQIAQALKASRLKCEISPSMVKLILAGPAAKRRAKMKKLAAQRAANLASKPSQLLQTSGTK